MKTIVTVTNCSEDLKEFMLKLSFKEMSLEEILRSRDRDGLYFMRDRLLTDKMSSILVINVFIDDVDINPLYDISVSNSDARMLITNIYTARELPYCELSGDLFKRQNYIINNCEDCFVKCPRRLHPYIRNEEINAIFNAYCDEIYETYPLDYKKVQIAVAKGWPIETDIETFKKYALTEEEVFEEFLNDDFNSFSIMAPLIKRRCPEYLQYYFKHRKLSLKELLADKYTKPW